MFGENLSDGPVDAETLRRVASDPYAQHMVRLIDGGLFPESEKALRDELTEHMGHLMTEEELPDVVQT